jgi:hypothetical protein
LKKSGKIFKKPVKILENIIQNIDNQRIKVFYWTPDLLKIIEKLIE